MKTSPRHLFPSAAVACFLTLTFAAFAQDKPAEPAAPPPAATEQTPAVAVPADQSTPTNAAPANEPAVATPATTTPAPVTAEPAATVPAAEAKPATESEEAPKLRRLDEPTTPVKGKSVRRLIHSHTRHNNGNEIVAVGHDAFLAKDHKADSVVAVFGSATSEGEVSDAVVSVLGNTRVTGPVGEAAVAVFGSTTVNSKVGDAVVAVFGNVELGPDAEVGGDVVAVGGSVIRDPKAIIHGEVHNVSFGGAFSDMAWLRSWFVHCALYGRLLAFGPNLMWAWWIALSFLAFYVVLALLFGKGVDKCVQTVEQRPGYTILTALLTVLLAPIVTILLVLTGVGIAIVPFLAAGLFFASIFGKVVMLAWLGRRFTKLMGVEHPALAVLVGGVIVLFLYTVPVLGIVLYKLLGWIGVGVVVYTLLLGMKREKPAVPPVVPPAPGATAFGAVAGDPAAAAAGLPPLMLAPLVAAPPMTSADTLPRAGFWIRLAAMLLDVVLVGMICGLLSGFMPFGSHVRIRADLLPVLAVYGAVMWKLKGTTVGGIVCGLKVVRLDDRPIDWGTAIVRALGCFLSLIVLGLGFIWVVFDDQRQSWHDRIAGTTVVRMPKGVSLV